MKNLLSLDYGTHKTGIAYSLDSFCFPYKTIRTKNIKEEIEGIIKQKNIEGIIIGMPYNIDGSISKHAQRVSSFIIELKKITLLPIFTQDERLTTSESRLDFIEEKFDGDTDTESARKILERFLESQEDIKK